MIICYNQIVTCLHNVCKQDIKNDIWYKVRIRHCTWFLIFWEEILVGPALAMILIWKSLISRRRNKDFDYVTLIKMKKGGSLKRTKSKRKGRITFIPTKYFVIFIKYVIQRINYMTACFDHRCLKRKRLAYLFQIVLKRKWYQIWIGVNCSLKIHSRIGSLSTNKLLCEWMNVELFDKELHHSYNFQS